jgi:hypothetical protein
LASVGRIQRHAGFRGDLDLLPAGDKGDAEPAAPQLLQQPADAGPVHASGKNGCELVRADAGDEFMSTGRFGKTRGCQTQQFIAGGASERVVQRLEILRIGHYHCEWGPGTRGHGHVLPDPLLEFAAIGEARQRIEGGEVTEALGLVDVVQREGDVIGQFGQQPHLLVVEVVRGVRQQHQASGCLAADHQRQRHHRVVPPRQELFAIHAACRIGGQVVAIPHFARTHGIGDQAEPGRGLIDGQLYG